MKTKSQNSCILQNSPRSDKNLGFPFSVTTDNCLPYCWKPKFDKMKTQGRKNLLGAKTEAECKEMCSTDRLCDGVDWLQPNKSCWHDYRHVPARPNDNFHHWEIVRDVLTHCPKGKLTV